MSFYEWKEDKLILDCHLQPKSKADEFCGLHGDALKIRITAPPVDGKANLYLIKFLAKAFGVRQQDVEILSGESSRRKRIAIKTPSIIPKTLEITTDYSR
jgi:uncharacterized protein (TIGR00251 family)